MHLQKLYDRLKDYEPTIEYHQRLRQLSRTMGTKDSSRASVRTTGRLGTRGVWRSLLAEKERRDSLALTRVLTSRDAAVQLDSPRGLMLHGEVGTGKSMLVDLFADCLPTRKKRRWHFNTFMLETIARLEELRRARTASPLSAPNGEEEEYSLLWLAGEMVGTSPILFLDEFQLPDRATAKIMASLMTAFFQLGGVLIATSNRMPEELAQAAGAEYTPPPASAMDSLRWRFGAERARDPPAWKGEYADFLDVVRARCEIWEMDGLKDYRRTEARRDPEEKGKNMEEQAAQIESLDGFESADLTSIGPKATSLASHVNFSSEGHILPQFYFNAPFVHVVSDSDTLAAKALRAALRTATGSIKDAIHWEPTSLRIYGRTVPVPRQLGGTALYTFRELCESRLGPADYVSLASTFHTIVLTDIPVLSLREKEEARRLITLLDALYESRCKLLVTAAAGPDGIFFPTERAAAAERATSSPPDGDALHAETFAEAYQDATAPFRPNISSYAPDALEDDPPNRVLRASSSPSSLSDDLEAPLSGGARRGRGPDFGDAGAFTGEDERFAFRRAQSRLWEMCGAKWWARGADGEQWWRPLEREVRRWEGAAAATEGDVKLREVVAEEPPIGVVSSEDGARSGGVEDEGVFRHGASPFRTHAEPPPKFSWVHAWGMVKWGKRAGAWGKGTEGLEEKKRGKEGD